MELNERGVVWIDWFDVSGGNKIHVSFAFEPDDRADEIIDQISSLGFVLVNRAFDCFTSFTLLPGLSAPMTVSRLFDFDSHVRQIVLSHGFDVDWELVDYRQVPSFVIRSDRRVELIAGRLNKPEILTLDSAGLLSIWTPPFRIVGLTGVLAELDKIDLDSRNFVLSTLDRKFWS